MNKLNGKENGFGTKYTLSETLGDNTNDAVNDILSQEDINNVFNIKILSNNNYKIPQFNFLKTIGEFIDFLEKDDNTLKSIKEQFKEIISDFLGADYQKIIDFFTKYPSNLDIEITEFEKIINKTANEIDFAKLSFISPIIEELNQEIIKFQEENLPKMSIINNRYKIENIFNNSIGELAKRLYKKKDKNQAENILYSLKHNYGHEENENGEIIKKYQNYTFIREYLNSITGHAGIIPILVQRGMIKKSGLLNKNEVIKVIRPKKILLPGNDIIFERKGDKIIIKDSKNGEIYSESKIKKEVYKKMLPSKEGIELGKDIGDYDEEMIMHDEGWHYKFSKEVPIELYDDRLIPIDSGLLEHIGFRLFNGLILNKDNIKNLKNMINNKKLNKIDFDKLKGIFASIEEVYLNPDFKELIKENNPPIIKVTSAKPARGPVKFDIEIITNDKKDLIGKYRIMIA